MGIFDSLAHSKSILGARDPISSQFKSIFLTIFGPIVGTMIAPTDSEVNNNVSFVVWVLKRLMEDEDGMLS